MNERQQQLLNFIVTEYIRTAQPVGSQTIAVGKRFDLSPATIRNEMAALEQQGYITHPHTSAGRVPTEKGYQFYISHFLTPDAIPTKQEKTLREATQPFKNSQPDWLKALARQVASCAHSAVFISVSPTSTYYTGVSELLAQPEFSQQQLVQHLGKIIDHFDQVVNEIFDSVDGDEDVNILIGRQNPFGRDTSAIIARYQSSTHDGIIGILGPLRMNYQQNVSLIRYSIRLVNSK